MVSTTQRPVPLQHHLYTGNSKQTQDQLFMIVGEEKKFIVTGYEDNDDMGLAVFHLLFLSLSLSYKAALEAKKKSDEKGGPKFGAKGRGNLTTAQVCDSLSLSLTLHILSLFLRIEMSGYRWSTCSRRKRNFLLSLSLSRGKDAMTMPTP